MLRQEEVSIIKAISTLELSPTLLKELRLARSHRKQKPPVPAGNRRTTSGRGARVSQQLVGKRKSKELASTGDSLEPAK